MKERANRLYELRKSKGTSQSIVGDFLGISQSRVSDYENGGSIPSEVLILLADYFEVSTDYILYQTDIKRRMPFSDISDEECALLALCRQLSAEQRKLLKGVIAGIKKAFEED